MDDFEVFKDMELYPIDRYDFVVIFYELFKLINRDNIETSNFKYWRFGDEYYFLHKTSGTLIYYYKILGRSNTCNKILTPQEYAIFVDNFITEIKEEFKDKELIK